jgi:hypothetical protein
MVASRLLLKRTGGLHSLQFFDPCQNGFEHLVAIEIACCQQFVRPDRCMKPGIFAVLLHQRIGTGPNMAFGCHGHL